LEEGTPDHPGEPLETAEVTGDTSEAAVTKTNAAPAPVISGAGDGRVVQAAIREADSMPATGQSASQNMQTTDGIAPAAAPTKAPATGTVVLEVEQGGIEVPSFLGKTVRGAVEAAQESGLQLEAVGSGLARQQSPPAGTHVTAGARVTVQFGR